LVAISRFQLHRYGYVSVRNYKTKRIEFTRRGFLGKTGALTALLACGTPAWQNLRGAEGKLSVAEAFDRAMDEFMKARKVPGGALAVVKDRRLVYVHGYGWADREGMEPVKPESLFRIASVSKPFTAIAVLNLAQAGRLSLDDRLTELLDSSLAPNPSKEIDKRLRLVTVRQCLHHTGGWDRDQSGDPMFRSVEIARQMDVPAPARQDAIIRYEFRQPLDFAPGSRFAYSNFGYCVLGRVIEKLGGESYEQLVREEVLHPLGISRMRLGASLENQRADGEVKYYTRGQRVGPSVFASSPGQVPEPYGTFCLEAMDSHGGWLASALDLARLAAALDTPDARGLLNPQGLRTLYEPPKPPVGHQPDGSLADHFYGCGWDVRPIGNHGKANYWHFGSLPGTFSLLVRRYDGISWTAIFNQRSEDSSLPDSALDSALHRAADAVGEWPRTDLF
jgi:CubicO group peptidase (beta-lactamase class C family)